MKSERRHELQHNELAEWLVKSVEAVKPYQNGLLAGVAIILVVMVGYTLWSRASAAQSAQAWDSVNAAIESGDPTMLSDVADAFPGTSAAHMASLVLADYQLGSGCNQLFKNKALAQETLSKAISRYESLRAECRTPSIRERALYGLARARESKGELSEAETLYKQVAKDVNSAFALAAEKRLTDLKRPATEVFYRDFAKFDPKPDFTEDSDGKKPVFDTTGIPDEGPITTTAPVTSSAADAKKTDEKPKADTKASEPKKEAAPAKAGKE